MYPVTILVTSKLDPSYSPTVFYITNNNNVIAVGITPNQAAPVRSDYGLPQPPVLDIPRLSPGSTIMVDNNDEGEEAGHGFKPDVEDDSDTSYPSSHSSSSDPPSSSAASTQEESSLEDGRDSSSENASGQVSD